MVVCKQKAGVEQREHIFKKNRLCCGTGHVYVYVYTLQVYMYIYIYTYFDGYIILYITVSILYV